MGLGGTAKKLQKVIDMADEVYTRLNDLREQVVEMRETTQETKDRIERLEVESAEMRALLEALAEEQGIDVESVTADAHIREAEADDGGEPASQSGDGGSGGDSADADG
ncbi:MAG: DUF5798 family protein [Halobellus sp.]